MQFWLPVIMSGTLFALRAWHVIWIARVMIPRCQRPWWKRPGVLAALALIGAMYLASAGSFKEDATEVANYRAFIPHITYASYTGGEGFLALGLVPLTWWTITVAARGARQGRRRKSEPGFSLPERRSVGRRRATTPP